MTPIRNSIRFRIAHLITLAVISGCAAATLGKGGQDPRRAAVYSYRAGYWFTGNGFESRTMYVANGHFVDPPTADADSVIDLAGAFVVPPFAEAHNHWLESRAITAYTQNYLRDGVFYLQDQGNPPFVRAQMDSALNLATSVDFIGANQGWTGPGGHPLQIGRQFIRLGIFPANWTDADLDRNAVMVVSNSSDIAERWPQFIAGRPDFVKVFLLYSEEYARRSSDSAFQFRRGLDPRLLPEIVRRAHASRLRVSAHIYTAADFRIAISAGVDIVAHFPGTGYDPALGVDAFRITEHDAQLAAEHHAVVITTLYWLGQVEDSARNAMLLREVVRPNWALLRKHGVPLLVGSDEFRATPVNEASVLVHEGLFTPLEAIRSWSVLTPREIFPSRRIGELAVGYEASFLALNGDPVQDFTNVTRITLRVKQGRILRLMEPQPALPRLGP